MPDATPSTRMPEVRGALTPDRPLDGLTWLRVGGPADWLFQPADHADLADFLRNLDAEVPVFPMGVGSNLIVRDGGIRGVVIRLGRGFNGIEIDGVSTGTLVQGNRVGEAQLLLARTESALGPRAAQPAIAAALGISVRTVETYYARISEKLDLSLSVRELRKYAIRHFNG